VKRRVRRAVLAALLSLAVAACGGNDATPASSSSPPLSARASASATAKSALHFNVECVTKKCESDGKNAEGTFRAKASNFTPNGPYIFCAWYPNGTKYDNWMNPVTYNGQSCSQGMVDAQGAAPGWSWKIDVGSGGSVDPPGNYRIQITDIRTGRSKETTFTIHRP
jgi:hypothetical protein